MFKKGYSNKKNLSKERIEYRFHRSITTRVLYPDEYEGLFELT